MKRVVYQGIEGSFSHLTALRLFGPSCQIKGLPSFREVFDTVENGDADVALMPIENTLAGTIYETIDYLSQGSLQIVGMTQTRIVHSLLGIRGSSCARVHKVLSHPKALAQCTRFFSDHSWMRSCPHYDTAGAAADVAAAQDSTQAAIAHSSAAAIYGLDALLQGIEDHRENYTRFFLLSKQPAAGKRCSLCFMLDHRPGSLAEVLSIFAKHQINLTYIVSRPLIGQPFEYLFYADLENAPSIPIEELREKTRSVQILGHYDVIL
jgi:prephenate dehydratase